MKAGFSRRFGFEWPQLASSVGSIRVVVRRLATFTFGPELALSVGPRALLCMAATNNKAPTSDGSMDPICDDLVAEHDALHVLIADLADNDWDLATPAAGWSVRDQVSHLAYFDEAGHLAATDPEAFRENAKVLMQAAASGSAVDASLERGRASTPSELLSWWRDANAEMVPVFRALSAKDRLPWYGPDMGARSFATARLMEVWAHGQDVADALGVEREPTQRLRHVAHIANGARPYAYLVNGMDMPEASIRVEIVAPNGEVWSWGEETSSNRITGNALDFCLVAIQRRHLDDVELSIEGEHAQEWASIIQTFAGGAGSGRSPLSS